eukprot:Em0024g177a
MMEHVTSGATLGTECFENVSNDEIDLFGIDWEEFCEGHDIESVEVPETDCPCSDHDMVIATLRENFDPLCPCDDYGISSYLNVKDFLAQFERHSGDC